MRQTAIAGKTMKVGFSSSVNPDCTARTIPTLNIIAQPTHGTAQIVRQNDYPHFASNNIHASCNKTKVEGTALYYAPNPDYEGNDFMSFEIINDEGGDIIYNDIITVKSLNPPPPDSEM